MNFGYKGDARYEPLTAWDYFWLSVLYSLPIVGFVFLIINSFRSSNINRRSFTRSYFCGLVLALIFVLILTVTGGIGAILGALT